MIPLMTLQDGRVKVRLTTCRAFSRVNNDTLRAYTIGVRFDIEALDGVLHWPSITMYADAGVTSAVVTAGTVKAVQPDHSQSLNLNSTKDMDIQSRS
jgi:hypothetical protein